MGISERLRLVTPWQHVVAPKWDGMMVLAIASNTPTLLSTLQQNLRAPILMGIHLRTSFAPTMVLASSLAQHGLQTQSCKVRHVSRVL